MVYLKDQPTNTPLPYRLPVLAISRFPVKYRSLSAAVHLNWVEIPSYPPRQLPLWGGPRRRLPLVATVSTALLRLTLRDYWRWKMAPPQKVAPGHPPCHATLRMLRHCCAFSLVFPPRLAFFKLALPTRLMFRFASSSDFRRSDSPNDR